MSITKKQYSHLNEMGITLWQQRQSNTQMNTSTASQTNEVLPQNIPLAISSESIVHQKIFLDILQSINCSIGEITIENNTINLGLFNWQFIDDTNTTYSNNLLTTPSLASLKASPELKSDLWQLLQKNVF